jgi:hypothetical protein
MVIWLAGIMALSLVVDERHTYTTGMAGSVLLLFPAALPWVVYPLLLKRWTQRLSREP